MRQNARFADVQPIGLDVVAEAAGTDPDVLRMENLDTDVAPPPCAVDATTRALASGRATVGCR
ncbi:hypothetical protein ACFQYP_56560 [Nonomuraea antimicrobica]